MKKKRLLSMLLAATLLFSLTACARTDNGEEPSDEQPSQGTTSQAPADPMEVSQGVTDDTIKIGTISLVSGAFAYIGQPAYDGLRACIERFNAQGGVQGRKLEIVAYDDQYDAATGKAIVERMVEQDQVFALVGLGGNIVETSLDYLKEKGIPVINISSGLDSVYAENDPSSNIFQIQPANMTDARNLIARVLHESIFGPNKDEKLPADAKIAVVHGTDSASMSSLAVSLLLTKLYDRYLDSSFSRSCANERAPSSRQLLFCASSGRGPSVFWFSDSAVVCVIPSAHSIERSNS